MMRTRTAMIVAAVSTVALCLLVALGALTASRSQITLGSKSFTESSILGNLMLLLVNESGTEARLRSFPGSAVAFNSLLAGEIDAYPEYTGTLKRELLASLALESDDDLRRELASRGIRMSDPLGFNNTYAIGVSRKLADELGLRRISDLREHPQLRFAFSTEFMNRGDGWPGLRETYRLPQTARGIEHSLAYAALAAGSIDATDLYATDAQIAAMDLAVLADDLGYFPRYDAVLLYRDDLEQDYPEAVRAMLSLVGQIDEGTMRRWNERAEIARDGRPRESPALVAAAAFQDLGGAPVEVVQHTLWRRIALRTKEHLTLVGVSMFVAIILAIPLGVIAARSRLAAGPILAVTGILQTIPAIALLVLLIKPFGIGPQTAIIALILYSLLPIVRNTHAGLIGIAPDLLESAHAIGLSSWERLGHVEIPLALPTIMAGIKTAAVINVGAATLGGFISAGGYGQPIFTGITQNNFAKILEGAVPAAVLAILVQFAFSVVDRAVVPRGLRRSPHA
jgi:osmoprotectant transport system permease protein